MLAYLCWLTCVRTEFAVCSSSGVRTSSPSDFAFPCRLFCRAGVVWPAATSWYWTVTTSFVLICPLNPASWLMACCLHLLSRHLRCGRAGGLGRNHRAHALGHHPERCEVGYRGSHLHEFAEGAARGMLHAYRPIQDVVTLLLLGFGLQLQRNMGIES